MPHSSRPSIAVVGGGPAGLMAAEVLAVGGAAVTLYDRMPSLGRKFLLAGRGGLNLTHSESLDGFLSRYGWAAPHLKAAIAAFPPDALRAWSAELGQPTFVGTSGRVFPAALKTSPLLRAWLRRLAASGVTVKPRHRWTGWDADGRLTFVHGDSTVALPSQATVLALGGASWPHLGSDGAWVDTLASAGAGIAPLRPANCGFLVDWSPLFRDRFAGQPLKRLALSCGSLRVRGEAMITRAGLEGGGLYALSACLRDDIAASGAANLYIDLRPDLTRNSLIRRLDSTRGKQSISTHLRKSIRLSPAAIGLLNEAVAASPRRLSALTPEETADLIKSVPIRLTATAPIARAISTAGGIAFASLDEHFMLRARPGVFAAGEMLDWEAPTGGYLLQATFATGAAAARGALRWIAAQNHHQAHSA
ncbi:MAG: TIGR03862 family flavoprotein [Hyphomicrobiaceae bacterium]